MKHADKDKHCNAAPSTMELKACKTKPLSTHFKNIMPNINSTIV